MCSFLHGSYAIGSQTFLVYSTHPMPAPRAEFPCVTLAVLELRDPPVSAPQVVVLKATAQLMAPLICL